MSAWPVGNDILVASITATVTPTLVWDLLSAADKVTIGGRYILSIDTVPAATIGWITEALDSTGFPGAANVLFTVQGQNLRERLKVKAVAGTATVKLLISLS